MAVRVGCPCRLSVSASRSVIKLESTVARMEAAIARLEGSVAPLFEAAVRQIFEQHAKTFAHLQGEVAEDRDATKSTIPDLHGADSGSSAAARGTE